MATERLTTRRIRQVLHLHFGVRASARVIAREVGVGRSTVQDYLTRATTAGLGWPLSADLTDEALELLLFPAPSCKPGARRHPEPDWAALAREMKRPGNRGKTTGDAAFAACPDAVEYDSLWPCHHPKPPPICRAPSWKPRSRRYGARCRS